MTSDSFTVQPLFFPGGNIGSLAIHGTVNDLSVTGAKPRYLSLNAIIEEGLNSEVLEMLVDSIASAAQQAEVHIVTGDTKVVPRGHGGELYLITTGLGQPQGFNLQAGAIKSGDIVIISGPVGNHGIAVMMAREEFGLSGTVSSDSANVWPLVNALNTPIYKPAVKLMRDPTRGGLNTVLQDWSRMTHLGIEIDESTIPVDTAVQSVCDLLGYDPINLACEGRVVAVIDKTLAEQACAQWRCCEHGQNACIIGQFTDSHTQVVLNTPLGGQRVLHPLIDDPLPRIC